MKSGGRIWNKPQHFDAAIIWGVVASTISLFTCAQEEAKLSITQTFLYRLLYFLKKVARDRFLSVKFSDETKQREMYNALTKV